MRRNPAKNIIRHPITYSKTICFLLVRAKSTSWLESWMRRPIVIAKMPIEQKRPEIKLLKGSLQMSTPYTKLTAKTVSANSAKLSTSFSLWGVFF